MTATDNEPASTVDLDDSSDVGAEESFTVTIQVGRYLPEFHDDLYWDTWTLEMSGTDRVLDALHKIKWEMDGSLTFRRSCAHGICGSDAVRINGFNRLACKVLLKDLDISKPIQVEPIKGLPVEKDLIVDMEPFFQSYREIMPFLIANDHEPMRERFQSAEDRERYDDTTKCILCAACTSACPVFWTGRCDTQQIRTAAVAAIAILSGELKQPSYGSLDRARTPRKTAGPLALSKPQRQVDTFPTADRDQPLGYAE